MESIKNRTSIRKYADREISEELLNSLLQEAERTPTMGNLQLYSVVVTRSEEGKKALAPAHFNQPMVTQAPVVLTICADYRRTTAWANHRKAHPGYDNILSFMNAATDALLFTQTFTVLAEAAGLGTCFLGTTVYMPQMIIDTLHLPQLVMPVATLTVGWPDENCENNVMDMIADHKFDLIINVPKNRTRRELTNGYRIRRGAIDHNIPLMTNVRLAKAFIEALCTMKQQDIKVKSWQEYNA